MCQTLQNQIQVVNKYTKKLFKLKLITSSKMALLLKVTIFYVCDLFTIFFIVVYTLHTTTVFFLKQTIFLF